ncbi:MAG: hypothetical protein QNJ92_07325 [Alphaproteobacteria bacterium]|nr:hypothetical protein [Alphaproteobacteria bacterium]
MSGALKSWVLLSIGWACVVAGLITLPTPLPLGAILFAIGLPILYRESRVVRRVVIAVGQRFPGPNRLVQRVLQRGTALVQAWADGRSPGGVAQRLAALVLPSRPNG